ncbi:MAG: metallophosphoesterase family protein [Nitrospira sp.]
MEQARRFDVEVVEDTIESLQRNHDGFQLRGAATIYRGRRVLLATGLTHLPPEIEGVRECLGVGQCGWIEPSGFAVEQVIELAGYRVALYHRPYERGRLTRDGASFLSERIRPSVCMGTHQPKSEWREGVLLFNPGSAGPNRFHLPRALG